MIRVLLAEDQAMVRDALVALLRLESDIAVVAEAAHGDQVVPTALSTQPDVALLDREMPSGDGLQAAQALRAALPSCRVVILTTFGRSGYLRRAMESGAVGFLLKDAPAAELVVAIRRDRGWAVRSGLRSVDRRQEQCGRYRTGLYPQSLPQTRLRLSSDPGMPRALACYGNAKRLHHRIQPRGHSPLRFTRCRGGVEIVHLRDGCELNILGCVSTKASYRAF